MATHENLLQEAADLLSDSGENEEYDRAIVELSCRILGVSTDYRDAVHAYLRALR